MAYEAIATLLDQITARITRGDQSLDLEEPLRVAQDALNQLHHIDGVVLLSRLSLLWGLVHGKAGSSQAGPKTAALLLPLNPSEDGEALRSLAAELRRRAV